MENMILVYTNENFGKVRLVICSRQILYCANDIARCLGYADPWSAVKNHCGDKVLHPHISGNGMKVMNFISKEGVEALAAHSRSKDKDAFVNWLVTVVVPDAIADSRISMLKPEIDEGNLPNDVDQYLIGFGDYFRHVSHEYEMLSLISEIVDIVSPLPECKQLHNLKSWAKTAEEYIYKLFDENCPILGAMMEDDPDDFMEMMEKELGMLDASCDDTDAELERLAEALDELDKILNKYSDGEAIKSEKK